MEIRQKVNSTLPKEQKLSLFTYIVKAYSVALLEYPLMNSIYDDQTPNQVTMKGDHNISIAIDTPIGLVAPNIKRVQDLSIMEVQGEILRLKGLSVNNRLGMNELYGGTSSLSNIGSIGGRFAGPLNLENQVSIVALGALVDTPKFVEAVQHEGRQLYDVKMSKIVSLFFYPFTLLTRLDELQLWM